MPDLVPGIVFRGYTKTPGLRRTRAADSLLRTFLAKRIARHLAHTAFAASRSLNFCSLPVEVFGISANTT
jgi:hypothetical protein